MELDRNSYFILGILRKKDMTSPARGMTIKELMQIITNIKYSTMHKKIRILVKRGYIKEAARAGHEKAFYITEKGLSILPHQNEKEGTE